jgi:hypothetical protein
MENIIIRIEEPAINLPLKKRPLSSDQIYKKLLNYPISEEVIRYPKQSDKTIQPIFHDLITANINQLIPNIDIGYQMNMDCNQMFEWILTANEYINKLNDDFKIQCSKISQKLVNIEQRKERSKIFDMEKMNYITEDIIQYIYTFLLPETKILLLRARYPNLNSNIMRLNVSTIKRLFNNIQTKYYQPIMISLYKDKRYRCLPKGFCIRFGYINKIDCIDKINTLIETCEKAIAHKPSDIRYFQKKALKIMRTLVYVAKRKQVLDKPYAPELEVETEKKPVKSQRKLRNNRSSTSTTI